MDLTNLNNLRGIEREALRINKNDGSLSQLQHPKKLGHKLTNDSITVDFSENLLEVITKPNRTINQALEELRYLTAFTLQNMSNNENILNSSMPLSTTEDKIQVADFGQSNSGKMKEVYRNGLESRYGKIMQVISGIHYNFSFDERLINQRINELKITKSDVYLGVVNNYFQYMWLLPYLFGASPICAKTSVKNKPNFLKDLDDEFYYGEYATSLRMSNLGYTSPSQEELYISYENISSYAKDIILATEKEFNDYSQLGLYNKNNKRIQLNKNILQIENEYYSSIRPKQIAKRGERPACALLNRGVEYIEVRVLDVDLFTPEGISKETALFIEALLMTCLIGEEHRKYSREKIKIAKQNLTKVATYGRKPDLTINCINNGNEVAMKDYGIILLNRILKVAKNMGKEYLQSVEKQMEKMQNVQKTPSAQIIEKCSYQGYKNFILLISNDISNEFREIKINQDIENKLKNQAKQSVLDEQEIVKSDNISLNEYIDNYYKFGCGI